MFVKHKWVAVVRGSNWVTAKVSQRKSKINIVRLAEAQLEGEPEEQVLRLKEWLAKHKVPVKELQLAVSLPGVITRMITLPILTSKDLDKLLTEQVDQYFTLNIEDYVVDYRVLDYFEDNGQKLQRILLAAIPKFQWESLWSLWEKAGLKPKVVDLAADGLSRLYAKLQKPKKMAKRAERPALNKRADKQDALKPNSRRLFRLNLHSDIDFRLKGFNLRSRLNSNAKKFAKRAESQQAARENAKDIAIIDLNDGRVEMILLERGVFFLFSDMVVDLSMAALESGPKEPESTDEGLSYTPSWGYDQLENALSPVIRTLSEFFNFFSARHYGKTMDCIYLTGELANLPRLKEIFESNLEVETMIGFPNGWMPRFGRKARETQKVWMKYGSLYGLALRED